jgi:transposase
LTQANLELLQQNLIPLVGPTSRLLLDNAKIHKVNTVLAILDHFQIEYLFLSPYSPDCIEYLFGYIKQQIKNYPELELTEAMRKIITSIEFDEQKLQSWIKLSLQLNLMNKQVNLDNFH